MATSGYPNLAIDRLFRFLPARTSFVGTHPALRAGTDLSSHARWDHVPMCPRVLIVDDHDGFRAWARAVLVADGYEVVGEAIDGSEGLKEALRLQPDLAVVDIQLPDIDGLEVARLLSLEVTGLAVILVSSRDAADYGGLVEESTARGFLNKDRLSGDALRTLLVPPA